MRIKTSKGKKVAYSLICVFVFLPRRLCAFCAFGVFGVLVRVKSFCKKKKEFETAPNDLIYITTIWTGTFG